MPPRFRPRLSFLAPVFALLVFVVSACATGVAPEVTSGDPVLVEGRELYIQQCSSCHGLTGGGGRGSKLNEERVLQRYPDVDDQIAIIRDGRNQMPAFGDKLDDDQMEAVVRYTREILALQS